MSEFINQNTNKEEIVYGSKGQNWSKEFIEYMNFIVSHKAYTGMPDAIKNDGKIQWEAPSNRSGGQYQFTHNKRKSWWIKKAEEIGIDPESNQWISKTAKVIHPTGEKPCKKCGRTMKLAYVYPKKILINRLIKIYKDKYIFDQNEPINLIFERIITDYGKEMLREINFLLSSKNIIIPSFENTDRFLIWLENHYLKTESSLLSPGAMSNAPDRFDGFHSFNKCCRGKADKGRSKENLSKYVTDRRVFEFWSDGDWIAADKLMGIIRAEMKFENSADGGIGSPTADHIGPLSLGFRHMPKFRLLSQSANSAKNNRMSFDDVLYLRELEKSIPVTSWYAKSLWDLRKKSVSNEENALRISKMLRDNQRLAMRILSTLFEKYQIPFLIYLLNLDYANYDNNFLNLRIDNYVTVYDKVLKKERSTKYSIEQKIRRIRVGLFALENYISKENRHYQNDFDEEVKNVVYKSEELLNSSNNDYQKFKIELKKIFFEKDNKNLESDLKKIIPNLEEKKLEDFEAVKQLLKSSMDKIAKKIASQWGSERYVRD